MRQFPLLLVGLWVGCAGAGDEASALDPRVAALMSATEEIGGKADAASLSIASIRDDLHMLLKGHSVAQPEDYIDNPVKALGAIDHAVRLAGYDPSKLSYVLQPKLFRLSDTLGWDHSEVDLVYAIDPVSKAKITLPFRLIGDFWGAGVYRGAPNWARPLGPQLCATHQDLEDAIDTSYLGGSYAVDFVCHTVTGLVLDALGAAPGYYGAKLGGYYLAKFAFGPWLLSDRSSDPSTWRIRQQCAGLAP